MNPSKIFERMREDHRRVLDEIKILEAAAMTAGSRREDRDWPGETVLSVLATLGRQFDTHMAAEDEILYPALSEALPGTRPSIEPLMADHGTLRMMLSDLDEGLREPPSTARNELIGVQLRDLVDLLRIHIRKEEVVVFAVAERALPAREVEALAARMDREPAGSSRSTQVPVPRHSKGAQP